MGDYFFGREKFLDAFNRYQSPVLLQNTNPASRPLIYQARLMAGRAALAQKSYNDARNHVTNLLAEVTDDSVGPRTEAFFLYGEIEKDERIYANAINAFVRVSTNHWLGPRALGHIGDCYLQLAATNSQFYKDATNAYQQALDSPLADVESRTMAEYAIAQVLEKLALDPALPPAQRDELSNRALNHYLNILSGEHLRPERSEQHPLYWFKRTGITASQLAERLGRLNDALNIYKRLRRTLPSPQEDLDKKIQDLTQRLASSRKI